VESTARDVDEVVRAGDDRLLAQQDLDLSLEEVVGLVLARMDVRGRSATRRYARLHDEVRTPDSSPVTRNV
jgi:hypothetical protein